MVKIGDGLPRWLACFFIRKAELGVNTLMECSGDAELRLCLGSVGEAEHRRNHNWNAYRRYECQRFQLCKSYLRGFAFNALAVCGFHFNGQILRSFHRHRRFVKGK